MTLVLLGIFFSLVIWIIVAAFIPPEVHARDDEARRFWEACRDDD